MQQENNQKGVLYIVSTPIGNREDITVRALRVLFSVDLILCEDTRKTYFLLKSYQNTPRFGQEATPGVENGPNIGKKDGDMPKLESFFQGNEDKKMNMVLAWLKEGKQIALVSNSGTPLISDPGFKLVRECAAQNICITPLPGACAAIAGLSASGLPTDKFLFLGFLPLKKSKRQKLFDSIKSLKESQNPTIIIYESPYRLVKTLEDIKSYYGDSEVTVAQELSKKFENFQRGNLTNIIENYKIHKIKGEIIIIV